MRFIFFVLVGIFLSSLSSCHQVNISLDELFFQLFGIARPCVASRISLLLGLPIANFFDLLTDWVIILPASRLQFELFAVSYLCASFGSVVMRLPQLFRARRSVPSSSLFALLVAVVAPYMVLGSSIVMLELWQTLRCSSLGVNICSAMDAAALSCPDSLDLFPGASILYVWCSGLRYHLTGVGLSTLFGASVGIGAVLGLLAVLAGIATAGAAVLMAAYPFGLLLFPEQTISRTPEFLRRLWLLALIWAASFIAALSSATVLQRWNSSHCVLAFMFLATDAYLCVCLLRRLFTFDRQPHQLLSSGAHTSFLRKNGSVHGGL